MKKSGATIKLEQYCFTQGLNTHGQVDKWRKGRTRDTKPVLEKEWKQGLVFKANRHNCSLEFRFKQLQQPSNIFKNVYELIKANLKSEWQTDTTLNIHMKSQKH